MEQQLFRSLLLACVWNLVPISAAVADEPIPPGPGEPVPRVVVVWAGNGRGYERVLVPGIAWTAAKEAVKALEYNGLPGHLVTVNSPEENQFLTDELGGGDANLLNRCWLGAFQPEDTAEPMEGWRWITDEPFEFTNWSPAEPNDASPGEDVAMFDHLFSESGKQWNDAPEDYSAALGYIVEYESDLPVAPLLLSQPSDQQVLEGTRAIFQVTALGSPALQYRWLTEGGLLDGATNLGLHFLVLDPVQPAHAGGYYVVVTNEFGAATSRVARLTLASAGIQVMVPATANPWLAGAPDGTRASGTDMSPAQSPVEVTGVMPGKSYSFIVSGTAANYPTEARAGPDGFPFAFTDHDWVYQNGIGNVVAPMSCLLGVFLDPEPPSPDSPEPPVLDFSALGLELPVINPQLRQPFFIGDAVAAGVQQQFVAPEGATRLFLAVMDSYEWVNNAGAYAVTLVEGLIPAPTPPRIFQNPTNQWVRPGETALFSVGALGTEPMGYLWYLQDRLLPEATNGVLAIANVQPSQTGLVHVIVWNPVGSATSQVARLEVDLANPASTNVALGKPVTLMGTFEAWSGVPGSSLTDGTFLPQGTPWNGQTIAWYAGQYPDNSLEIDLQGYFLIDSLVVQVDDNDSQLLEFREDPGAPWQTAWVIPNYDIMDGVDLWGMQTRPRPNNNNARYILPSPIVASALRLRADPGNNDCCLAASEIQAWGSELDLTGTPPRIVSEPSNLQAPEGTSATFHVGAIGETPLAYQWWNSAGPIPGAVGTDLLFTNVTPVLADAYFATIGNAHGTVTSRVAQLTLDPSLTLRFVTNTVLVRPLAGPLSPLPPGFADGPGSNARFAAPNGGYVDTQRNVYIADRQNHRIRRIAPDGQVTTLAGTGSPGFYDGFALWAMFQEPIGLCVDAAGIVYVADAGNHRIRRIDPGASTVTTVAGTGTPGYSDGPGATAQLNSPSDLVVDPAGNIFFTEFNNHTVRRITPDATVSTWAGKGEPGDADGTGSDARFRQPAGIALDREGNLYVTEYGGQRVRMISAAGVVTTLAGSGVGGYVDAEGTLAQFSHPDGIVVAPGGDLFVADNLGRSIRRIAAGGRVETVVGYGRAGTDPLAGPDAWFGNPTGLGIDAHGVLMTVDATYNQVRRIFLDPVPITIEVQPQSTNALLWSTATLEVVCGGSGPLEYLWYTNGLPGSVRTRSLVLDPVMEQHAGTYFVVVSNVLGAVTSQVARVTIISAPQTRLANGGFEQPVVTGGGWNAFPQMQVPGWKTTASDGLLALWNGKAMGVPSYDGDQHLWFNPETRATLYQEIQGYGRGAQLGLEFAYRVWQSGEKFRVTITDLGADWTLGGLDDTELFTRDYSYTPGSEAWTVCSTREEPPIVALGNPVRVAFEPLLEDPFTIGNLLDGVAFGPGVAGALAQDAPPVIFAEPEDTTAGPGEVPLLSVVAAGGAPLSWRWFRTDGPMPTTDISGSTLVLSNAQPADSGQYGVLVTNAYGAVTSRLATVLVSSHPRPQVVSVAGGDTPLEAIVLFSTPVESTSATRVENYRLLDEGTVTAAGLVAPDTVLLQCTFTNVGWHTLLVDGVRADFPDGLPVARDTRVPFLLTDNQASWLARDGVGPGMTLDEALADPRLNEGYVGRSTPVPLFESPSNDQGSRFLGRVQAYIYPPVTGTYRFWMWCDDAAILYLGNTGDPPQLRAIARSDAAVPYREWTVGSEPVELHTGRSYYLEVVYLEQEGTDGAGVTWQLPGAPPPAPGDLPLGRGHISTFPLGGAPRVTLGTANLLLEVGQPWEIQVGPGEILGTAPHSFQWLWNGAPMPGATDRSLVMPWAEPGDQGARIALRVTNAFGITSRQLGSLTIVTNGIPPTLEWVEGNPDFATVSVRFSEAVTMASASDLTHYTLTGGPTITAAERQPDGRTVLLSTSVQSPGTACELSVQGIEDLDGNRMPGIERMSFSTCVERQGQMAREIYRSTRISIHLQSLLDLPAFRSGHPASREIVQGAETPTDAGNHYGQRLWGWLVAPQTGEYRLAIAADESAALYLGSSDRRTNLQRVAFTEARTQPREWTRYTNQVSEPQRLEAGKAYAFEALMCEGEGGDHLALGWIPPGASEPSLIESSALLLRIDPRTQGPTINHQPTPVLAWAQAGGAFRITAVGGSFVPGSLEYQWQRNGSDIPGARGSELLLPVPLDVATDSGALYRCVVTDSAGNRILSTEAALTVLPQSRPATITLVPVGGQLRLTWEAEPGLRLQQAIPMREPDWHDVPGTLGTGQFEVTPSSPAQIFRLWKSP